MPDHQTEASFSSNYPCDFVVHYLRGTIARADSGKNGVEADLPIGDPSNGNGITWFNRNVHGEIIEVDQPSATGGRFTKSLNLNGDGAITDIDYYPDPRHFDLTLDRYNRPIHVSSTGGASQTFSYDIAGNTIGATDNNHGNAKVSNVTTTRTFDTLGNLLTDGIAVTSTTGSYSYQSQAEFNGTRRTQLTTPKGTTTKYHYLDSDHLDLLEDITVDKFTAQGTYYSAAQYEWIGSKPLETLFSTPNVLPDYNRAISSRRYDEGGVPYESGYDRYGDLVFREDEHLLNGSPVEFASQYEFQYNADGRLTHEFDNGGIAAEGKGYVLDGLDRVTQFHADSLPGPIDYFLDEVNNIRQAEGQGGVYRDFTIDADASDGPNRVSEVEYDEVDTREITYDASGNILTDDGPPGGRAREYTWDDHGRLAVAEVGSGTDWRRGFYAYDAFNRRVYRHEQLWEAYPTRFDKTEFHLYGDDVVEEFEDLYGKFFDRYYVIINDPTAVDRYVAYQYYLNKPSTTYQYTIIPVTDRRNNVVALLGKNGIDTGSIRTYDLHGQEEDPSAGSLYQPHRFAGRVWDPESDLYYYRSRYYDPSLGRFISLDTIGIWGDLNNYGNGYAYVGNMGNSLIDPFGKQNRYAQDKATWYALYNGYREQGFSNEESAQKAWDTMKGTEFKKAIWEWFKGLFSDKKSDGSSKPSSSEPANEEAPEDPPDAEEHPDLFGEEAEAECGGEKCVWDEETQMYVQPAGMAAPDSREAPNLKELIQSGRIKVAPTEREKITEYSYDQKKLGLRPGWRQLPKKPALDGRRPSLSWWRLQAPAVNWDRRMGLLPDSRSGIIDPLRNK